MERYEAAGGGCKSIIVKIYVVSIKVHYCIFILTFEELDG